jgi:hypothetical protein
MVCNQSPEKTPKNPYVHRGPIKDPRHFFGRVQETREILDLTSQGQSVSMVGPRRIGKTSLLLHLCHSASAIEADARHLYVFLDLQRRTTASPLDVYHWMWEETLKEAAGRVEGLPVQVESAGGFEEAIGRLRTAGFQLTLLLDEFELMAKSPQLDLDFFFHLRSLTAAYPVSYVTTSGKPLLDLEYTDRSVLSSPFFNIFHRRWFGFLTPEEATELIVKPVQDMDFPGFTQEDIEFVVDLAGYHPAFLQIACYHLFEYKVIGERWDKRAESEVLQRFRENANDNFRYAWTQLGGDEQEAMRLICTGQADEVSDPLWDSLAHQCLVYERRPFSSAFREFVLQQGATAGATREPKPLPGESVTPSRVRTHPSVLDLFIGILVLLTIATLILSVLFRTPAGLYISAASLVVVVILSVIRSLTA